MRALLSRRRGSAGRVLCIKKKARGFMCGCGGTKAISISDGTSEKSPMATPQTAASTPPLTAMSTTTTTTTKSTRRGRNRPVAATTTSTAEAPASSFSSSSLHAGTTTDDGPSSMESTPSLSALLRQLGELERSVRFLHAGTGAAEAGAGGTDGNKQQNGGGGRRHHRRTVSEGCGGSGRVEESVAVVKESADPLGDFRRSMLQMIVENEIVGGAELRELLHRFLSLNSQQHHHLILRAFAEIWEEVFAGYERTPDLLVSHRNKKKHHLA